MNNRQTISAWLESELLGIGIVIIVAALIWGYCVESLFIAVIGSGVGIFLIRKSLLNPSFKKPVYSNTSQDHLPALIFKDNAAAFKYICSYVVFPDDMAVGIVTSAISSDGYTKLKIKCLFNEKILMVENSFNMLNNRVKEGDLVVCLQIATRMVVSHLLSPELNPNTVSWKVLVSAGDMNVHEIPVDHLEQPRGHIN